MIEILQREFVYLWYYFDLQLRQIFWYWVLGMVLGSAISVFAKEKIHDSVKGLTDKKLGAFGVVPASILGIASPLCMYGTIPLAASFSRYGISDDWLAAFMMSSILLNPQLIIYSMALGLAALAVRIISCFLCGTAAGLYFLIGTVLSAVFQRYVSSDAMTALFGGNEAFGVLMAATIGVPLYACGGGTIPLLQAWLADGMSMGSASAFMLTGPSTKITNLGALKIVLGVKHFALYIAFVMVFSLVTGLVVNLIL